MADTEAKTGKNAGELVKGTLLSDEGGLIAVGCLNRNLSSTYWFENLLSQCRYSYFD